MRKKKIHFLIRRGFTIVELLVVVAIIGLIITVAVVSLANSRQKSRDAKRISDIDNLKMAIELYSHNQPLGLFPEGTRWSDLQVALSSYINNLPLPPTLESGDYYFYSYNNETGNPAFYLGAILEDSNHSAFDNDNDDQTLFQDIIAVDANGNDVTINATCEDSANAYCVYVE